MPARLLTSAEIEAEYGIPKAEYQKLCRAKRIEHYRLGLPGAKRARYASTAAQVKRYLDKRLVRTR